MNKRLLLDLMQSFDLGAYITVTSDEHLDEFIHEADKRVKFLTGFSGSNGVAITSEEKSVLYTDPRYFIQAKQELRGYELMREGQDDAIDEFIGDNFSGKSVGIPLKHFPSKKYKDLETRLKKRGVNVVRIVDDLVDAVWRNKPERKFNEIMKLEDIKLKGFVNDKWIRADALREAIGEHNVTGSSYRDKVDEVKKLFEDGEGLLISDLGVIAWMFNLRGSDIESQSTFYSYVYMTKSSTKLFISSELELDGVEIHKYKDFARFLEQIDEETVVISEDCNAYIYNRLKETRYTEEISRMRSIKNKIEVIGFELAGTMDGVALTRLFGWIDSVVDTGKTEKQIAEELLKFKKEIDGFVSQSFSTIVGSGENGAILHHEAGEKVVSRHNLILTDSGSQYYYGTTDISRTVHFGMPDAGMKRDFTLVLKGAINARMLSKEMLMDKDIDGTARRYLNDGNLDYETATGHGVGHFLSVHERPPLISGGDVVIEENQVFTIEPGLSREGKYGIRIEDMVLSTKDNGRYSMRELTFVPLSLNLIDVDMLDDRELDYINEYSATVYSHLKPYVEDDVLAYKYLENNTRKLERSK